MRKASIKTLKQIIFERSNNYSQIEQRYKQETGVSLLFPNASPPDISLRKVPTVSVVIPAYNVQLSILSCLTALEQSSFNMKYQNRLQVILVDDGSTDDTWDLVKRTKLSLHLIALRQINHGQAQALNTGISIAEGDIIISCDPDMILGYYAIEHFVACHQRIPNALFTGFRLDTPQDDPRVNVNLIRQKGIHIESFLKNDERISFPVPGWPSNMCLASEHFKNLGQGHSLWMPDDDAWLLPDLVFGALFSLSKSVFLEIGGYDERFLGWGCADGYLAAKVIGMGNYIIPLYAASGLHVSHLARLANKQLQYEQNRKLFFELIKSTNITNHPNWLLCAKERIIESFTRHPKKSLVKLRLKDLPIKESHQPDQSENEIDNLLAVGEYTQALTAILFRIKNNQSWKMQRRLAKAYFGMNQYKEAASVLDKISTPANLLPEVKIELMITYAACGRFESARKILNKLVEQINPKSPTFSYWCRKTSSEHILQGKKYLRQGFSNTALHCFEAALIGEPNNKTASNLRSKCMGKLTISKASA